MDLPTLWFAVVALFWTGYLVLEGFDFGVGMLLPVIGRRRAASSVMLRAIGPVWDGNEVWLIVAVGAMFAAFPAWYAVLLSALYVPLVALVLTLVLRAAAFELGGHLTGAWWRRVRYGAIVLGSVGPAAIWGGVLAAMRAGLPVGADGALAGGWQALVTPAPVLGAAGLLALCGAHGALFLALKTDGEVRTGARRTIPVLGVAGAALAAGLGVLAGSALDGAAALAMLAAVGLTLARRDGLAFAAGAASLLAWTAAIFTGLYPRVLISTAGPAHDLTVAAAAASPYALTVMSWMALAAVPFVLVYQGWSYWVFRRRLGAAA